MGGDSDALSHVNESLPGDVARTIQKSHHRGILFQIRHNHGLLLSGKNHFTRRMVFMF